MTKGQASPTTPSDWDHSKLTPHGPGVRPFKPAAIALAAGAPWIARGYSGNPNQMARLIAEAIAFEGFSFVHVLSQCITYCPEQTDWKNIVHERSESAITSADEAARLFLAEDGFATGLLYRQERPCWPPASTQPADQEAALATLAARFGAN
jgi:2-oxoglutarate ferredoxin oxidoreductase subunit beta